MSVDAPTYDAKVADDVPYLDIAAVKNADGKTLTFFAVNRHPDEALTVDVALAGFKPKAIVDHMTIAHPDLQTINTAKKPDAVVPKKGKGASVTDAGLRCRLPPKSYHMIRVGI